MFVIIKLGACLLFMSYLISSAISTRIVIRGSKKNCSNFFTYFQTTCSNRPGQNRTFKDYDKSRIAEVGPDRACAEWLLRNGAAVKFENAEAYLKDYNGLPGINVRPKIIEVDATDSSISMAGGGFRYFENLKVRSLKLHRCNYLFNDALYHVNVLSFSLKYLQVSSCANITDDGILALSNIKGLETLYMYDLPGVQDRQKCIDVIKNYLPQCNVNFPWAQESERTKPKPPPEPKT